MDYQKKARALKAAGFVDYDLRKNLNQGQKAYITKIWKSTSAVITNADNFVSRKVSQKAAKKMKADGYTVNKHCKVFVQKEGYQNVKIKSRKQSGGIIGVTITRETGNKKSVTKVYTEFELFKALANFDEKKLKKNQSATVRIGDNAAFKQSFKDPAALMLYVQNTFMPKDPGSDRDFLISQMSIVTISENRPETSGRFHKQKKTGKNARRNKR